MFQEYVAADRFIGDLKFDFLITNDTAKLWYDGSPDQFLPERQWCISQIKPGFTIVDCGAHHGVMSVIFALAAGPTGKVVSYEALASNAEVIRRNASLNGLANIDVRPVGVGAVAGRFSAEVNASNIVINSKTYAGTIDIVRLDEDLPQLTKVDFLKVDVEGHEVQALRGMKRIIGQRPIIDLEVHNFLFANRVKSLRKIAKMLGGYTFSVLGDILGSTVDLGQHFDIDYINSFDNPHVFCTPIADWRKPPFWKAFYR